MHNDTCGLNKASHSGTIFLNIPMMQFDLFAGVFFFFVYPECNYFIYFEYFQLWKAIDSAGVIRRCDYNEFNVSSAKMFLRRAVWFMSLVYVFLLELSFFTWNRGQLGALRYQNVGWAAVPSCSCDTVCIDTQEKARFQQFCFWLTRYFWILV